MLVPRPQVKVLVHNSGSYPPSYDHMPTTTKSSVVQAKPADIQPLNSPTPELKDRPHNSVSPVPNPESNEKKDSKVDKSKGGKESDDDGKVFTTLQVATKKPKNANGRELLAQRTKISSDSILLEPLISTKSPATRMPEDHTLEENANNKSK